MLQKNLKAPCLGQNADVQKTDNWTKPQRTLSCTCLSPNKEREAYWFFFLFHPLIFFILTSLQQNVMLLPRIVRSWVFFLIFLFLGVGRGVQISLVWGAEGLSRLSWWQASFRELISFSKQNVNLRWGGERNSNISSFDSYMIMFFITYRVLYSPQPLNVTSVLPTLPLNSPHLKKKYF